MCEVAHRPASLLHLSVRRYSDRKGFAEKADNLSDLHLLYGTSALPHRKNLSLNQRGIVITGTRATGPRHHRIGSARNSVTRHCSLRPTPHITKYRQAAACPRAAQKSATYRSLRFIQVAALVPSAGTVTLQIELHSDACAISTRAPDVRALLVARDPSSSGES